MEAFVQQFTEAVNEYCVGKKITKVEANGTFESPQSTWIHLEGGLKITFYTGSSGCDSDNVYACVILDAEGQERKSFRHYPPSSYDGIHDKLKIAEPSTPPMRTGFAQAEGLLVTAPYFSGNALGLVLDSGKHLISHTAGSILYATWLYEPF